MTDMRTKATQSVAEILEGLKRDAVQAVKHLLKDRRLEAMPVDAAIRLSWMDEDGRACGGNIAKVSLDGDVCVSKYRTRTCPACWMKGNSCPAATSGLHS